MTTSLHIASSQTFLSVGLCVLVAQYQLRANDEAILDSIDPDAKIAPVKQMLQK
jgi:hypothetical protein